jgi:hypothetical protein
MNYRVFEMETIEGSTEMGGQTPQQKATSGHGPQGAGVFHNAMAPKQ